uniref:Uncharacterized protein n=1 Tax=Physcomitrium patens TaxID=3218 RepID=A0A2K1KPT5_PHYPA|nr:hypothetical protein PHYPA_006700 [Physcomitrium patens]
MASERARYGDSIVMTTRSRREEKGLRMV